MPESSKGTAPRVPCRTTSPTLNRVGLLMRRLETSTLWLLPPPPSIKPQSTPVFPTDYDAATRPQGTVPDIGADEFSLGSQPPEAPTNVRVLVIVSGVSASLHH